LLGQLRERLRYLHYSMRTEEAYVHWARFYIHFHDLRHPRDLGKPEIEAFLQMLASERKVSVSTHRQALSALLFLYKEVLGLQLPWLDEIGRPQRKRRIPAVLTVAEVQRLFTFLEGETGLLGRLLYGSGMRLNEALSLRVKDVDFDKHAIVVREGKGGKDRVVMLPHSLASRRPLVGLALGFPRVETIGRSAIGQGGTASPLDALPPSVKEPQPEYA
jgi:integrase